MTATAQKSRGRPPIQDVDYNAARARKMEADAQMAELELLQAQRKLVQADDVLGAWTDVLGAMKAKLLALPTKCAPLVATEKDISIIQNIIENQVHEALQELSGYDPNSNAASASVTTSGSDTGDSNAKAATAPKRGRVGRPRKAAKLGS